MYKNSLDKINWYRKSYEVLIFSFFRSYIGFWTDFNNMNFHAKFFFFFLTNFRIIVWYICYKLYFIRTRTIKTFVYTNIVFTLLFFSIFLTMIHFRKKNGKNKNFNFFILNTMKKIFLLLHNNELKNIAFI